MHLYDSARALVVAGAAAGQQTPYLSITGTARIVEGGAPELLTELTEAMLGGIGPWVS